MLLRKRAKPYFAMSIVAPRVTSFEGAIFGVFSTDKNESIFTMFCRLVVV